MQPAPMLPAVEYAERSDPGRDPEKQVNEDACGHRETRFGHLCVVCDGMGGHASGREAAELALATIFEVVENAPDGTAPAAILKSAIEEASHRVAQMSTAEVSLGRPGATCVAVLMHARGTEVAHVGDSRAYLAHEGQVFRLTRDHSVVQEMVDRGLLTPQQAAHHPDANRITRALGMAPEVDAELLPQTIAHAAGDTFVLCSDGLSDLVEDHEILALVAAEPAAQAAGKLIDLANARGGHDNITVIVARARESAFVPTAFVAPTVAETAVTQAPATVPVVPPVPTFVETGTTQPGLPAPAVIPPAPMRPVPISVAPMPLRRRANPVVIAGVLLALAAFALLAVVLLAHILERGGKRTPSSTLPVPAASGQPATPTPLAPQSVVVPGSSASAEPIAPLEPSPAPTRKR
jgi:serine/threonine protein phosphatase PrpC